ncbi:MAG TPA: hypothetical protein VGK17_12200 [Propionicimonas sp.]
MRKFIKVGLGSLVITASLVVAAPVQASTSHCDSTTYPNKVEVSGDNTTVHTDLRQGTVVCLKAATETTLVYVDAYGNVTNTAIVNQKGIAQGISYYAWGQENPS